MDLGFEKQGFDIAFVNENHPPFLKAYKHSRKKLKLDKPLFGFSAMDVKDFLEAELPAARLKGYVKEAKKDGSYVGFIGGPPCPDFSMGGKHKGFDGENGRLTRVYYNLVIQQNPDWFLFENVRGFFRTKKHRQFFNKLLNDIRKAGYAVSYDIVNALEFGVPQYRDRVIVFGIKKQIAGSDVCAPSSTEGEFSHSSELKSFDTRKYANHSLEKILKMKWPVTSAFKKEKSIDRPKDILLKLTVEHWLKKNKTDTHPNASHHFIPTKGNKRFLTVKEGCTPRKSYKRLHRWRYSPTAAYGNNEVHLHPYKSRRISAAEALAIQSMPPEFELPSSMPLSDMFKTIGNGVPYLMGKSIAGAISDYISFLEKNSSKSRPLKSKKAA